MEPLPKNPKKLDLTSTIHLSHLSKVSAASEISARTNQIVESLTANEKEILRDLPRDSAMLIVLSGPSKGSRFLLNTASTSIGRNEGNDIFLDDVTVSRKHATIKRDSSGEFSLEDSGSLNGTYVDSIICESASLIHGNEIHIGKYKLIFFHGGNK